MAGRTLNAYFPKGGRSPFRTTAPTVFISYFHRDRAVAVAVAAVLERLGIRYWLDLQQMRRHDTKTDKGICEAIEHGIAASSHLLGVLSPATRNSHWVPYEVGLARATQTELGWLLKNAFPDQLPGWVALGEPIKSRHSLGIWLAGRAGVPYRTADGRMLWEVTKEDGTLAPYLP